ncbi:acetylornithine transaminase [Actinomyces dentalis]|uniref:acetylornithine transaminase n=1 Tax=Actinomyces dentalis TaxID=272548 RepID=UPI0028E23C15|nr:acetylornithine transaminase [Actinomyces dentalis]
MSAVDAGSGSTAAGAAPAQATPAAGTGRAWAQRYGRAVMNTFGAPQRVLVRGRGARVWDADGAQYTDLLAGIAVNCLGHAHPAVVGAVTAQLSTLGHVSNFFTTPAQITLAEELIGLVFPGADPADSRVFLANSGTEANEGAFKIARRHGGAQRPRVLALTDAFHGRTMGSLALTHKAAYREPFEPLPGGVEFVPAGDGAALAAAMGPDVAALIVEPIQGEAGVRELPPGYLEAARELTGRAGALLIIDEVQTGMGRTGAWMAHHLLAPSVTPDVVTLAKGLGGGVPIGAVVATGPAAGLLGPGQHGTTFGGNPVACAAALAVIATIRDEGLLERAGALGERWSAELAAVPGVTGVRGRGLLRGVGLADAVGPAAAVAAELMERGFIVNAPRPDTLRLAPPLILPDADADRFTAVLRRVLADRLTQAGPA